MNQTLLAILAGGIAGGVVGSCLSFVTFLVLQRSVSPRTRAGVKRTSKTIFAIFGAWILTNGAALFALSMVRLDLPQPMKDAAVAVVASVALGIQKSINWKDDAGMSEAPPEPVLPTIPMPQ